MLCGILQDVPKPLLYPKNAVSLVREDCVCLRGAGDGSRTHLSSLGSYGSTDELRPHRNEF